MATFDVSMDDASFMQAFECFSKFSSNDNNILFSEPIVRCTHLKEIVSGESLSDVCDIPES